MMFLGVLYHPQKNGSNFRNITTQNLGPLLKICLLVSYTKQPTKFKRDTPPKFNIVTEKCWLEDYFPFGMAYFQGRTVKLPRSRGIRDYQRFAKITKFWINGMQRSA